MYPLGSFKLNVPWSSFGSATRFVTAFFMVIDTRTRSLRYAQAGHNPPILVRAGSDEQTLLTSSSGLPLGINREAQFEEHVLHLEEGDRIVMHPSDQVTDGVEVFER